MVAEKEILEDESPVIDCPVLVTERLVMRPPHNDDIPELAQLANNRRVAEMLARMPFPYGETEARAFLSMTKERRTAGCSYALTLAESGAFIGCAGLNGTDRGLELGYWIGEPYWKRGYATEAAHALVDLAFRATAIDLLHVSCRVINPASRRVIHKCGFQYAGQGMLNSIVAGQVPVERYHLDRKTWVSLRTWARA
ncbi:Protein N-acetyltransferase, RimJ/RimL family [Mesorhizobium albiziae]|uniref:Protein N-acetyltransferase, RimJ/RimL family n=1 Tax=Neomesorhizobium albiziae TaxID=335020 RepID=A0A1I3XL03_9HYPH|nr:GNAT family N-acetyltransferase [Mesorhizobium albiziae]GLS30357.1 N-acetyltransferase GCN5 [Mesorhizobium albiziae]SFK20192.1 Protein N-acetyltransferase, RimJ/RimL family [Mesorhizobium albiziae]